MTFTPSPFDMMSLAVVDAIAKQRPATWLRLSTGEALRSPLTLNFKQEEQEAEAQ